MAEKEAQEVKTTPVKAQATRPDVESTRGVTFVSPEVDIYETDNELVLVADVPGVPADGLELKLEDNVLEITAHRRSAATAEPSYAEFKPVSYYRAFQVSDEIDTERIDASLHDGVLRVTLPKAPRAKPRTIAIKAG